jgi:hypothetical protein
MSALWSCQLWHVWVLDRLRRRRNPFTDSLAAGVESATSTTCWYHRSFLSRVFHNILLDNANDANKGYCVWKRELNHAGALGHD